MEEVETGKVEEGKIEGFDYRSTIRDPKTGKILKEQHYKRYISSAYGEFMERDGKFWAANGSEIPDPRIRIEAPATVVTPQVEPVKVEKKQEVSFTKKA